MRKRSTWLAFALASSAISLTLSMSTHVRPVWARDEGGHIRIVKTCSPNNQGRPGDFCTITDSNVALIPATTTNIYYDQAFGIPNGMLDSNVVLYVASGDWAVGRCTLDNVTFSGICTFSDGVGHLNGFHARVRVAPTGPSGTCTEACYSWAGSYWFDRPGDEDDR